MTEQKYLWEILVPATNNLGEEINIETHQRWDEFVRRTSGGLTIFKSVKGMWCNPNDKTLTDKMIPVRIMCSTAAIEVIAQYTLIFYDQEAVMYYKISSECHILERS